MANGKSKFNVGVVIAAIDRISAPVKKINDRLEKTFQFRRLTRSVNQFSDAMGFPKLASSLGNVRDSLGNVGREFAGLATKAALFTGGALAGVFALAKSTSDYGDRLAKVASSIGISVENLQELRFAAERSGISADVLDKSMQKYSKTLGEAKAGTGALFTILNKVSPAFLKQIQMAKDADEGFDLMVGAISKLKDPTKQAALASAAFGRAGIDMLNLLREGPEGIEELRKKARELGIMNSESAKRSEEFNDTLFDLKFAAMNVRNLFGAELMPVLLKYMNMLIAWITQNRVQLGQMAKAFAAFVGETIPKIFELGRSLASFFGSFDAESGTFTANVGRIKLVMLALAAAIVGPLLSSLVSLSGALIQLGAAAFQIVLKLGVLMIPMFKAIGAAILATPIGWLIAGIAAVAGAAYLIYKNWEPIKDFFFGLFDGITSKLSGFLDLFTGGMKAVGGLFPGIKFSDDVASTDSGPKTSGMERLVAQQVGSSSQGSAAVTVSFDNLPRGARVESAQKGAIDFGLDMSLGPMTSM